MNINAKLLRELIEYDPATGEFTWKWRGMHHFSRAAQFNNWNFRYPGTRAGSVSVSKGYRMIAILGRRYPAHRLAWLYVHGRWPMQQIDHINGDPDDNRLANLREVSGPENARNKRLSRSNKTGHLGVSPYPYQGRMKYVARIRHDGRLHHLGYFATIEDAAAARAEAERKFGFHENHGRRAQSKTKIKSRGFQKSRPAITEEH